MFQALPLVDVAVGGAGSAAGCEPLAQKRFLMPLGAWDEN